MSDPPGSSGWPVFGDQTLEFTSDPINFVESCIKKYKSRVFMGRLLNKPTVFVCSNMGMQAVLSDDTGAFEMGYKTLMGKVYGDNVLYTDDEEASMLRGRLTPLFCAEAVKTYQNIIDNIVEWHVTCIKSRKQLDLYKFFKEVITEITLTLFLGINFDDEPAEAKKLVHHTLSHWHGLTNVPVNVKVPGTCYESPFCRAMMAKKDLIETIKNQRGKCAGSFIRRLEAIGSSVEDEDFINNHLLLFSSALVPKALSSLLTTFAIEMGRPEMAARQAELLGNPELLQNSLKEVERICPPFIGGRRMARYDIVADGYKIPAGYAVALMTQAAHRDPQVFSNPNDFLPERWVPGKGLSENNLFVFGHGSRNCLGAELNKKIMQTVIRHFAVHFHWRLHPGQDTTFKHMPVARPRNSVYVDLVPLVPSPSNIPLPSSRRVKPISLPNSPTSPGPSSPSDIVSEKSSFDSFEENDEF